ncbi:androgen-dependent TFPI-regulating protein-like [Battus philenor]|uniref:androgen-dependent TFPI-regulating protein-like n=1 Tax=Battus philenor TaxID=42288 RepID=UPI0035D07479
MFLPMFHLFAAAINTYVFWYDQTYVEFPFENPLIKELPLKSRSMFLTIWCLIIQIIYHTVALLNDFFGSNAVSPKKKPLIRLIKDTLFSTAFPIAIYVSAAFWGIYAVDKNLIFPDHIEKLYPVWVNHVMHTTVTVFMLIELIATRRNYPSRATGLSLILTIISLYITWFLAIYFKTGSWVYPVFEPMNWPLRLIFISFSVVSVIGVYILGEKLNYITSSSTVKHSNGKLKNR